MPKLLLIDDEAGIRHAFRKAFHPPEYDTATVRTAAEGLTRMAADRPDAIVLDVHLPDADGLRTFDRIKLVDASTPVILITGHGTTDLAIEAMKRGAFDYLLKPLRYDELKELVRRACDSSRLMQVPAVLAESPDVPDSADAMVGRCPAVQEVYKQVGRVAGTAATVLLRGESGTGKELVARAIYQHSPRADKPFLAVNCAAIPENLVESELFGHEKGAFTGADRKRIGKFEQCDGGTLLLDEVGEMPPLAQVKLLRVLQEQAFERVGGTETVRVDVRVIAATNADLEGMTADGRFRKDLFFRLTGFTIPLPPLRDRGDDIRLLLDHYLRRFEREMGKPRTEVPADTLAALTAYPWPGNVRELQSVVRQSLLQMSGSVLLPDFLPAQVTSAPAVQSPHPAGSGAFDWDAFVADRIATGSETVYAESLVRMEREVLVRVLKYTNGNQLQAARILGITRGSLRTKIRTLGISIGRAVWSDDDQGE
ncbi:MAG: sigma-54 dependent transcriptional regulator [Gemmataceae bacterium]